MQQSIELFPLWLSVKTAGISTLIVFLLGTFFAYIISRHHFFGKSVLEALFLLPLVLPPTVVGFLLLYLFCYNGLIGKRIITLFNLLIVLNCCGVLLEECFVTFTLI